MLTPRKFWNGVLALMIKPPMVITLDELKQYRRLYLGSPYRNYPHGISLAARHVAKLAGRLQIAGINVFSPIAHGHMLSVFGGIHPCANEIWERINLPWMEASEALLIAQMQSWEISEGLASEVRYFEKEKKPRYFIEPETLLISNAA